MALLCFFLVFILTVPKFDSELAKQKTSQCHNFL